MQTIYDVPVILRREIEARMIKPFLDAFERELGHERTYEIAAKVIENLAMEQGQDYVKELGGNDLDAIGRQMESWGANDALEMELKRTSKTTLDMTVTRCVYVDMYERIGMKELGTLLSCMRDEPFYKGLNPAMKMERSKTLMNHDGCCDFRFVLEENEEKNEENGG